MFVDFAGHMVEVLDSGEVRAAQVFVAMLGAFKFTYAEATRTQTLPEDGFESA